MGDLSLPPFLSFFLPPKLLFFLLFIYIFFLNSATIQLHGVFKELQKNFLIVEKYKMCHCASDKWQKVYSVRLKMHQKSFGVLAGRQTIPASVWGRRSVLCVTCRNAYFWLFSFSVQNGNLNRTPRCENGLFYGCEKLFRSPNACNGGVAPRSFWRRERLPSWLLWVDACRRVLDS